MISPCKDDVEHNKSEVIQSRSSPPSEILQYSLQALFQDCEKSSLAGTTRWCSERSALIGSATRSDSTIGSSVGSSTSIIDARAGATSVVNKCAGSPTSIRLRHGQLSQYRTQADISVATDPSYFVVSGHSLAPQRSFGNSIAVLGTPSRTLHRS
jgi:hypothetical protein